MSNKKSMRVALNAFIAAVVAFVPVAPLLLTQTANAYALLSEREIKMSNSAGGASSVSYYVEFKAGTTGTVKSIAVDFCGNTPIIDDNCYQNTGVSAPTPGTHTPGLASATVDTSTANVGNLGAGWTVTLTNANRTLTIAHATGVAMTAGTDYYFTINGVANPTDVDNATGGNQVGTFYSRILTFPDDASGNYAGGYTATNVETVAPTDAGGIALSTASQITITSKVQERLSFCVYTGANCAAGGTTVTLGDTNGVLDPAGTYLDKNTKYDISTNAAYNAVVRLKGTTLTSGSNTVTAIGATKAQTSVGNEQFGFCTYTASGPALTVEARYNGAAGAGAAGECSGTTQSAGTGTPGGDNSAYFAYDTNATTGTGSTYGELFATKPAGSTSTGQLAFIGNIGNATEAGIYTTTLTFVATGTF